MSMVSIKKIFTIVLTAFASLWTISTASVSAHPINSIGENIVKVQDQSSEAIGRLVGFAFVDSSVTSEGSLAKLPAGTKIYPPGSTITGTEGCPKNRYHTDGLIVAVIDYQGRPNEGSITVIRHPAPGMSFPGAPYYLDLNAGRTLQYLGPIGTNGTYDVKFRYNYSEGQQKSSSARLTLARNCASGGGF
jgi:hypothetical protein